MKLTFFLRLLVFTPLLGAGIVSCNYAPQEVTDTIRRGSATIAADESLKPIVEAQIQAYKAHYPETTFDVVYVPEQRAINLMLQDSVEVIVVTRELNEKEIAFFDQKKIKYEPAPMALDAVALIVNNGSDLNTITINELKNIFVNKSARKKLVFDNSNSSNLGFIKSKLNIDNIENANIFAADGNAEVFDFIARNKNVIGVVGNNWISDKDNRRADSLRKGIRTLKVVNEAVGKAFGPSVDNLRDRNYPLERLIYLHTTQSKWGVAKGFIRFSCSQIGQLVVEKMGLIPYYIIPKVYIIDNTPVNKNKLKDKK
ncbi:MAG: phosphate transport system substrate-binding protein [Spirosomataceae bacterium]|jgi:phosphate transport system substrate-binding protein